VIYRIPLFFEEEQEALGNSLEIQINLDKVESVYLVKKSAVGHSEETKYKTEIAPDYYLK